MLSATRDAEAAECCFRKVLQASHTTTPRVITVDKNAAFPPAFAGLQHDGSLPSTRTLRQCRDVHHVIEQDHRFIKRRVNPGLGFGTFRTAWRTLQGYEAMHVLHQGQCERLAKGDILAQHRVINQLFGLAAYSRLAGEALKLWSFLQQYRMPLGCKCFRDSL